MTESFILASFERMGEKPLNVKVMRNKFTGEPAGYCFVHFENDDEAIDAMHKLNGKVIPNTNPVRLVWYSCCSTKIVICDSWHFTCRLSD